MRETIKRKGWLLPALLVAALSTGCSGDFSLFGDEPSAAPAPTDEATATTAAQFELRFVRSSAPPCANIWIPGQRLPVDYEWCTDEDGGAVAGPRIGSCEVVSYEQMYYAVPGYRIRASTGVMAQDPGFHRALTACKRDVAPSNGR